jgi:acetate kinase
MKCLIPNIGSTSFKFRVLDMPAETVLAEGRVERIGRPGGTCASYGEAIDYCLGSMTGPGRALARLDDIEAVGFKVVHAGPHFDSQLIDEALLGAMEDFAFLAPAHNPPYLAAIQAFQQQLPGIPLVAVLETSPYRFIPEWVTTYAVPLEWSRQCGMRRYGFHGASHRFASERAQQAVGCETLRQISCHLGGSSSVAAFRDGVAVDTSFGASPQSGLPQNNRVGDIDVFAVLHMMKTLNLDSDGMARLLCTQAGLAGISGGRGDVRDLSEAANAGDEQARLAMNVFVYSIRHYLGAFLVSLGGVEVITFSGGIGENSAPIRAAVLRDLSAFGVEIDPKKNQELQGEGCISSTGSPVQVFVIPANEEIILARETFRLVQEAKTTPALMPAPA